jgi:hypothetical protein
MSNLVLWVAYFVFAALALYAGWHPEILSLGGRLAAVKLIVWLVYAAFLGYSLYCSRRENLLKTISKISELHWGRQIGADLYIGLLLSLLLIYLNHGALVAALWRLPTLVLANLAVLLYVSIDFDGIVAHFLG